jgi:hypothetical protein
VQPESEKAEKADVYTEHAESPSPQAKQIHMMDEIFEWREVIRGRITSIERPGRSV